MSFARGERVYFDFDSGAVQPASPNDQDQQHPVAQNQQESSPPVSAAFVADILERDSSAQTPPAAPTFRKNNTTGFPAHRKREKRVSAFKQQRTGKNDVSFTSTSGEKPNVAQSTSIRSGVMGNGSRNEEEQGTTEQQSIDEENRQRLAHMSPEEIEQERRELMSALSPSLIEKLLKRGNIDEGRNERDWEKEANQGSPPASRFETEVPERDKPTSTKKVTFSEPENSIEAEQTPLPPSLQPSSSPPPLQQNEPSPPSKTNTAQDHPDLPPPSSIHFPTPTQPPDLDPSSPTFLQDLHQKYFPHLPYSPSSLSWMTPVSPTDTSSPYHPSHTSLSPADLRFDFKGRLLPPSVARELPTTLGLHHHADAPEAAGYTIPELARLARSSVPSQRCVAYQTLGRVLYRLGVGEFGRERGEAKTDGPVQLAKNPSTKAQDDEEGNEEEEEDEEVANDPEEAASAMATGLWNLIDECKVIESLTEEAAKERGHLTARTYAQEALWNWRRGGGRRRRAV
ncbi:uncharacterized protein EI97DRAFT_431695 [Westerdykella ornata]|uniref:Transcription factor Rba50 n=1 Tax=Westerdykella ornata TaxID=318751 RepID=A0A6A6JRW7_WESOR|nr:uncharacterized protein EI97DRAFT_431695 [Westerdykella ornata]KAF2278476.1 hypothetical protein EI97DRAFT_431695 [Westerdykella ornata]